jgi:DNA-binding NarL/FixJ family response regulator
MTINEANAETILCIDHSENSRVVLAAALRRLGYAVIEAKGAAEAEALLASTKPDIIVCEDSLPCMAATELLKHVRQGCNNAGATPFIFLSASADRMSALRLKELGADDILLKPIDLETVKVTLQACLAQVKRLQRTRLKRRDTNRDMGHMADVEVSFSNLAGTLDGMSRGVIYLDSSGSIRDMNRTAAAIVAEEDSLQIVSGRLSTMQSPAARDLREAIRAATVERASSTIVPVQRETRAPLVLHICPLGTSNLEGLPTVAVVIIDPTKPPPLSASIIAQIYGLTRSEARVAVALAHGNRLEEIAELFGVSQATVAFHVQNLFRKTRTTRQSDLVALLLGSSISTPVLEIAA